jgi:hypothetical protein
MPTATKAESPPAAATTTAVPTQPIVARTPNRRGLPLMSVPPSGARSLNLYTRRPQCGTTGGIAACGWAYVEAGRGDRVIAAPLSSETAWVEPSGLAIRPR